MAANNNNNSTRIDETAPLLQNANSSSSQAAASSSSSALPPTNPNLPSRFRSLRKITSTGRLRRKVGGLVNRLLRRGSSSTFSDDGVDEEVNAQIEESLRATAFHTHAVSGKNPSLRERMSFYLDNSTAGRWWEVFDFTINSLFALLYIFNSTYNDGHIPPFNHQVDTLIAAVLLGQWLPFLWLSMDPDAVRSSLSLSSLFATIPVIATNLLIRPYLLPGLAGTYMDAGGIALLYPFRFWRLHLSILRIVKPHKNFAVSLLLTVTSFVHMVERSQNPALSFWDVFYWIFVTASSGLSTKIVPDNLLSRLVVIYVMITGFVFLPPAIAELLDLFRKKSKYDHSYRASNDREHIVVVGDLDLTALRNFLREFFCEDHGPSTMTTRVVLMNPAEPSEGLKALFADPLYANRVTYVKGSTLSAHDLEKIKISTCRACFILASDYSDKNPSEVDAITVMRAISIKKFCKNVKLFVQ
ncbi:hypothetical protein HDU76_000704, partial [Blyttiomyces sp. JEL0837]